MTLSTLQTHNATDGAGVARGEWLILPHRMTFEQMLAEACRDARITREQMLGRSRQRRIAWPRQALMLRLFERGHSYAEIGRLLGRNHASAIHGVKDARKRRDEMKAAKPPRPPAPSLKRQARKKKPAATPPAYPSDPFAIAFRRAFPGGADYQRGPYIVRENTLRGRRRRQYLRDASAMEGSV